MSAHCTPSGRKDNADVDPPGRPNRTARVARPPAERPLLVYDGDCAFCRRWADRGRRMLAGRVDFAPSQAVADRFPEITPEAFARGVQFIDCDGRVWANAAGALHALARRPGWAWTAAAYHRVPGAARLAEALYRLVADHRGFFSRLDPGRKPTSRD